MMTVRSMVKHADLWQAIEEALDDRCEETWWIKVPSLVDIEGNKKVDALANEGVEKHGVKFPGEAKQVTKDMGKRKDGRTASRTE